MDGGSLTTLSIFGSQFQISLTRFKKTVPASFAGAVTTISEYCSPFDHALTLMERDHVGRFTCIVISTIDDSPWIFSSALVTISLALCASAFDKKKNSVRRGSRIFRIAFIVLDFKLYRKNRLLFYGIFLSAAPPSHYPP